MRGLVHDSGALHARTHAHGASLAFDYCKTYKMKVFGIVAVILPISNYIHASTTVVSFEHHY